MTKTYSPTFDYHCEISGFIPVWDENEISLSTYGRMLDGCLVSFTRSCKPHGIFKPAHSGNPEIYCLLTPLNLFGRHSLKRNIN